MSYTKQLRYQIFWWIAIALISVIFAMLLRWYWWHTNERNHKLSQRTEPMRELTHSLLTQSGNSDSLLRSSIVSYEELISGLDMTDAVNTTLRQYVSNLYTVAGAFDNAKMALPQTNDWEYLFNRGTISLLESSTYTTGNILTLYSGRQAIQDAVLYLSGAVGGTTNENNLSMSKHNLSVALASQIGIEILVCTESYRTLADSWESVHEMINALWQSYRKQVARLTPRIDPKDSCLQAYIDQLSGNIHTIANQIERAAQLASMAKEKYMTYRTNPLACPTNSDLYQDVVTTQTYENNIKATVLQNAIVEKMLLSQEKPASTPELCDSLSSGNNATQAGDLISQLSGEQDILSDDDHATHAISGSYQPLPEDTQNLINDIYRKNIEYIQLMEKTKQDRNYRPLQRLKELFREFKGDTSQFIK